MSWKSIFSAITLHTGFSNEDIPVGYHPPLEPPILMKFAYTDKISACENENFSEFHVKAPSEEPSQDVFRVDP